MELVLTVLEATDGAAADPGTVGEVFLRSVQERTGGAALFRRQGHGGQMASHASTVNINQKG